MVEERIRVEDLQLCNFSRPYFMGNSADPSIDMLQMAVLTENNGKIFRKEITNRENFRRFHESEIIQAFKDLFACSEVHSITMENQDRNQCPHIVIDSTIYHGVDRITIKPLYSKNNLPVSIPIQCFMKFK